MILRLALAAILASTTQPGGEIQATSLLGRPLAQPDIPQQRLAKLQADLDAAKADYDANPDSEDAAIWYGRRLAYLGRYRDAIAAYSVALQRHPNSYKLLRHRGHRYITVRELDKAIADLSRAAVLSADVKDEIEPDGAPNSRNIPRSTNLSNIWYHLALAQYLKGDFEHADRSWTRCTGYSTVNDDMLVATLYWRYLTLRRIGRHDEATSVLNMIKPRMDIIENDAYHRLLLMFKGELSEAEVGKGADDAIADATVGYGLAVWKLIQADEPGARAKFQAVLEAPNWAPFGFIAAEAELARMNR
jgi:tetratricopeptide (TPR) repeat protein